MPSSHGHEVTVDRAILLFGIVSGKYIDLGHVIHQGILRFLQGGTTGAIPYGTIVTKLCRSSGVRWPANEQLQLPATPIDHSAISRMTEWDGGVPHPRGLGYLYDEMPGGRPAFVRREQTRASGAGTSQTERSSEPMGDVHYRRLARRMDTMHDIHQRRVRTFFGTLAFNYALISKPLTDLLKVGAFKWTAEAQDSFEKLKRALTSALVLAVPIFEETFVIETDASKKGIGAVLMQRNHPLAFISRSLGPKWQKLSVYEKELLAIVFPVQKWEQYLSDGHFIIRTDQKSLKWLLQQKVSTPFQQFWLSKLLGFDYEIQYKHGKENLVADALSRAKGAEILYLAIFVIASNVEDLIKDSYKGDQWIENILQSFQRSETVKHFAVIDGLLRKHNKIVVGISGDIQTKLINWHHSSAEGGHSGRDLTMKRLKHLFYWKDMTVQVTQFIQKCQVCQRNKADLAAYPGLLQPLRIPNEV
ncbi:hypothetical protein DCAR_0729371 [Daucus carota subsp. sativus]|uniref:Integrase zinc-binding domain-containing protein n=1 Tax=Daucus carota subsp. sativus TaxID=79200 RepID=A0AAF0XKP7_DAUCS|nr:hypothetical protein DCAR_0729371 [Daucus carota subsp. sativus]